MKESPNDKETSRILKGYSRLRARLHSIGTIGRQIDLLSIIVLVAIAASYPSGIFRKLDRFGACMLLLGILGLMTVPVINRMRKTELAAIMLYCGLNLISLVTFQVFEANPVETVLTYIFLLSLIVFIFQTVVTRIASMLIIMTRIMIYALNAGALGVFDIFVLGLLALVFGFYGWKMYISESRTRQKTLFGQHMSHDLQVSFKSLSSTIAVLQRDFKNTGTVDPVLIEEAEDASKFYWYILNNFLDYSRKENMHMESATMEMVDLETQLETIAELHKYSASEKGVKICLEIDKSLPSLIYSDKVKLIRIVLNLLSNAIKNTHEGKTITLSVSWLGGKWQLAVANEGSPIAEEEMRTMFLPFDPTERVGARDRVGLGLPIAKRLIETLGGSISAVSRQGEPTVFIVDFPKG